ncbi:DUF550 domain-containing protein [Escherichia coli]|nr:DUF550 domain-containing protein [Escherichia coli]
MQFLLWDAQRRAGISDAEITAAMENKLKINMERQWPEPKDGDWIKQAQQAVNAFVRERDRDLPCISCGTLTSAQWDAGHYRTTAAAPQLRFDERNIHKQCVVCNQHKSGNLVPYRVELISRIGQEAVDEIESNHNRHRWTVEECRAIKAKYQQKLKDLRNSRSEAA